jgi:hypothetical protein
MIDKTIEITSFLKKHYTPGTIEDTNTEFQFYLSQVLNLLFKVFPKGCIDDYDLHQILTSLGYFPQRKSANEFVWCLKEI